MSIPAIICPRDHNFARYYKTITYSQCINKRKNIYTNKYIDVFKCDKCDKLYSINTMLHSHFLKNIQIDLKKVYESDENVIFIANDTTIQSITKDSYPSVIYFKLFDNEYDNNKCNNDECNTLLVEHHIKYRIKTDEVILKFKRCMQCGKLYSGVMEALDCIKMGIPCNIENVDCLSDLKRIRMRQFYHYYKYTRMDADVNFMAALYNTHNGHLYFWVLKSMTSTKRHKQKMDDVTVVREFYCKERCDNKYLTSLTGIPGKNIILETWDILAEKEYILKIIKKITINMETNSPAKSEYIAQYITPQALHLYLYVKVKAQSGHEVNIYIVQQRMHNRPEQLTINDKFAQSIIETVRRKEASLEYNHKYVYDIVEYEIFDKTVFSDNFDSLKQLTPNLPIRPAEPTIPQPIVQSKLQPTPQPKPHTDVVDVYIYFKFTNTCAKRNHQLEAVTFPVKTLSDRTVNINAYYCAQCNRYFVNNDAIKEHLLHGVYLALRYNIIDGEYIGDLDLRPQSRLMLYGYNVRANGLSTAQRQKLLSTIIDKKLMKRSEIIKNLQFKVDFNGKKIGNENAHQKWEEDIRFVSQYVTGNQRTINGKLKR